MHLHVYSGVFSVCTDPKSPASPSSPAYAAARDLKCSERTFLLFFVWINIMKYAAIHQSSETVDFSSRNVYMALVGTGKYAYRRDDGVYVVPIGCLKD